ncbi:MAG: hypothetical protein AABX03_02650 [Nanoarchaeota archaeon]
MDLYKIVLGVIVLIWAVPLGLILRAATEEELKSGSKYFQILWSLSIISIIAFIFFIKDEILLYSLVFISVFIGIVSFISWIKRINLGVFNSIYKKR